MNYLRFCNKNLILTLILIKCISYLQWVYLLPSLQKCVHKNTCNVAHASLQKIWVASQQANKSVISCLPQANGLVIAVLSVHAWFLPLLLLVSCTLLAIVLPKGGCYLPRWPVSVTPFSQPTEVNGRSFATFHARSHHQNIHKIYCI